MPANSEVIEIFPFEDSRGVLKKILMHSQLETGNIQEVYLIYTCPGGIRGNHYHYRTLEYFTVVSGRAVVVLKDLATDAKQKFTIYAGDNKVIKVPPKVTHAFKNEDDQPLIILAISTKEYDKLDPDTYTDQVL